MKIFIPFNEINKCIYSHYDSEIEMKMLCEDSVSVSFRHPKAPVLKLCVDLQVMSIQDNDILMQYSSTGLIEELLRNSTCLLRDSDFTDVISFDSDQKVLTVRLTEILKSYNLSDFLFLGNICFNDGGVVLDLKMI
jgi:hypothetical protein